MHGCTLNSRKLNNKVTLAEEETLQYVQCCAIHLVDVLQLCILDGNKFNSRCREMGEQMEILDECEVLKNQKGEPLMIAGGTASSTETPQVALKFRPGEASVSLK